MRTPVNSGFTFVEIILFLALTGLFLLIAFTGLVGRSRNVQFTDSIRSMEGFMQRQISDVRNGVNLTGDGDDSNQIVLGNILKFNVGSDTVEVYKIRGARLTDVSGSARSLIYESTDRLIGADLVYEQGQYQLEWGVLFRDPPANGSTAHYVGFLRNPNGTDIIPMILDHPASANPLGVLNNPETYRPGSSGYVTPAVGHFCLEGINGQTADIRVGESNRELDIEPIFNPGSGECSTI